jgi:hypothetical protein
LTGIGAGTLGALAGSVQADASKAPARAKRKHSPNTPAVTEQRLSSGVSIPVATWLVAENARPGTTDWVVTGMQQPHAIEGFASQVSAVPGDDVTVFVNTTAQSVHVEVYRMGYYQGLGGRLVYQSDTVAGQKQPPPVVTPGVNTVQCNWKPTVTLPVTASWPPGNYLLKLVGDGGQQQYAHLTVRDDASTAAFVMQNSVTTWQAYNLWGEYSLYFGRTAKGGSDFANRARIVSFDRPYPKTWAQGAADFFGNEFPLLFHLESLGADLTYWTDVDLHERPELLLNHRCLFSLGHDEYWSAPMRNGAQSALTLGTNLAFLGANACYRQIRLERTAVGPNRLQVCYKDAAEDPIRASDPKLTTVNWNQSPVDMPESELIGSMYQSVHANDDLVITDAGSWLFDGCGLTDGQHLTKVVKGEYDRFVPPLPGPRNVDVLGHSPVTGQGNWSDLTYYSAGPAAGGVLDFGMASFVYTLSNTQDFPWDVVPKAVPGVTDTLLRAMENVYSVFGNGPASTYQPSSGNWTEVYAGPTAYKASATGTNSA